MLRVNIERGCGGWPAKKLGLSFSRGCSVSARVLNPDDDGDDDDGGARSHQGLRFRTGARAWISLLEQYAALQGHEVSHEEARERVGRAALPV